MKELLTYLLPFIIFAIFCLFLGLAENTAKLNFMREGTNIWSIFLIEGVVFMSLGIAAILITKTPLQFTYLNWVYSTLIATYLIGYFYAIKMLPISLAMPFGQISTIFTVLIAVIFLHELLKPVHIAGISLITTGAILLTLR